MLRRLFHSWELSIFNDDADERRPQGFGWGIENLADLVDIADDDDPAASPVDDTPSDFDAGAALAELADRMCGRSDDFYHAGAPSGVAFDGNRLTFDSPLPSNDPEVRRASARMFEAPGTDGRAIIVIPQWNADESSLVGACRILNRFGFSVLRMTMPYHEERCPSRMVRADAMVSPVLGLTLQEVRRAVIEARLAVAWLRQRGYTRIGLMGTSLGSCVGFLALAHEEAIEAAAFNHVAGHFADVVWSGLATRHVRDSLDAHVDLDTLRRCWAPISPALFAGRLRGRQPDLLLVSGAYDPIFLPRHSQALVDALRQAAVCFRRVVLPCGHYTLGRPPFYLVDAFLMVRFFRRSLG